MGGASSDDSLRPFECAGCGENIASRQIHHMDGDDVFCSVCAPEARGDSSEGTSPTPAS